MCVGVCVEGGGGGGCTVIVGHEVKRYIENTFYHLVFKQGILTYLLLSKLNRVLFFDWEGLLKAGATHEIECDFRRFKKGIKKFRFFFNTT